LNQSIGLVGLGCAAKTHAVILNQHAVSATTYSIAQSLICIRSRSR